MKYRRHGEDVNLDLLPEETEKWLNRLGILESEIFRFTLSQGRNLSQLDS